jgi:predicted acetyltransferase
MEFISPTSVLESAFLRFYKDFESSDPINSLNYETARIGFKSYVNQLKDEAQGIYNAEGKVRCNHYWLINKHDEIMAVLRIRHHIDTPFLASEGGHISLDVSPRFRNQGIAKHALNLAKQKLKRLDIEEALITAQESNVAARKAIEASGGKLESIIKSKVSFKPVVRYWISTKTKQTNQEFKFAELV